MKSFDYYSTIKFPYPVKKEYTTLFAYNDGALVWKGSTNDAEKHTFPHGCVFQKVIDNQSFKKALSKYNGEANRLLAEFKEDLFENSGVSDNPKRFICFDLAWEYGHSSGLSEVYNYFVDLVELIK